MRGAEEFKRLCATKNPVPPMESITERNAAGNLSNETGITSIVDSCDATEHGKRQARQRSHLNRNLENQCCYAEIA